MGFTTASQQRDKSNAPKWAPSCCGPKSWGDPYRPELKQKSYSLSISGEPNLHMLSSFSLNNIARYLPLTFWGRRWEWLTGQITVGTFRWQVNLDSRPCHTSVAGCVSWCAGDRQSRWGWAAVCVSLTAALKHSHACSPCQKNKQPTTTAILFLFSLSIAWDFNLDQLSDRCNFSAIFKTRAATAAVTHGLLQGSVLGLLIFYMSFSTFLHHPSFVGCITVYVTIKSVFIMIIIVIFKNT